MRRALCSNDGRQHRGDDNGECEYPSIGYLDQGPRPRGFFSRHRHHRGAPRQCLSSGVLLRTIMTSTLHERRRQNDFAVVAADREDA